MVRTLCFDKNGMKKGAWSSEEDDKLRAYIQRYGHWNWRELPKFAGLSRCGKSCRLRWMNYLRPNVKRGNYTKEEGDIIIKLHEELGNRWSAIAAKLPGRTDNEIKNHWHTHLKECVKQNQSTAEIKEQSSEIARSKAKQKDQSIGRSQCEVNQKRKFAPKDAAEAPPQPILESSVLSPEPSSNEISSLSSDYPLSSGMNWVAEDSISSLESCTESIENFWTEPFLVDTSYNQNDFSLPLLAGEFLSPFGSYYDDDNDFFYQLVQELPKQ